MARGFVSITNTGLTEIADYLDKLGEEYQEIIHASVVSMQDVVVESIQYNIISMIGGETGRYLYDSTGKSTSVSKDDENIVLGTMGVYNIDSVNDEYSVTSKDLNAAQLAYWIEYGTQGLKRGRKVKGLDYEDEDLKQAVAAKPFISNAFYASINKQNDAFSVTFNDRMDKIQ